MQEKILPYNESAEFLTDEMCYINELSNSPLDIDVSIARARVKPGITTRWHKLHNMTERYVILEGKGIVEIGDLAAKEISYGDVVIIPPECRQRIKNTGDGDLIFLAICSPRFRQENYEDLGE